MSISTFTREEMERDDNKERRRVEISVGNPFAYISNRANRWKSRWRISNFKRQLFRSPSNYSFPFLSKRERGGASHATFVVRFKYWPSTRGYAWYPGVRLKYWNKILVYTPLFEFSPALPTTSLVFRSILPLARAPLSSSCRFHPLPFHGHFALSWQNPSVDHRLRGKEQISLSVSLSFLYV